MDSSSTVEVMDCYLTEFDTITRAAILHFCVWSELLDAHVIPVVQYTKQLGLRLVHSSGLPEADYAVINSEACLRDAEELVDDQYEANMEMN